MSILNDDVEGSPCGVSRRGHHAAGAGSGLGNVDDAHVEVRQTSGVFGRGGDSVWTLITVAASTSRQFSTDSLITIVVAVVIVVVTCLAAQTTSLVAVDVLMIGCCVNAAIVILQELKIFFRTEPGLEASENRTVGEQGEEIISRAALWTARCEATA